MSQRRPQRGSSISPQNRFISTVREPDHEHFETADAELLADLEVDPRTEFIEDNAQSVVSENDSPDIAFSYSLNPYRGCEHGCSYCYARPYHEYLGYNGGIDFETKILFKPRSAELLRKFLAKPGWLAEPITLSGITDCYQPAERRFELTRQCLKVLLDARQPTGVITKNALIVRDLDLLAEMASRRILGVAISITTLDSELAGRMEPRTSRPAARLRAIKLLSDAGVPVRVMAAPIIPGLNDSHLPAVLQAAAEAGATSAGWQLLRLPYSVHPVFRDWLRREQPSHVERIEGLVKQTRDGAWNSSQFGERHRGKGPIAEQIARTFNVFAKRTGLDRPMPPLDSSQFTPPCIDGQLRLF